MNFFPLRSTAALVALALLAPVPAARQCPMTTVTLEGALPGDHFGRSLALAGDELIVGAPLRNLSGYVLYSGNQGVVQVLRREGAGWFLRQELRAPEVRPGHSFGELVACDGRTLAVFAPRYFGDDAEDPRQLYIYERGAAGWELAAEHLAEGARSFSSFVHVKSLAVAGDWIFAGVADSDSGAVHVFHRAAGGWTKLEILRPPVATPDFGWVLSAEGDTLVVAAPSDGRAVPGGGSVHVYTHVGGTFGAPQVLTPDEPSAGENFGDSVSLSGDRLVIGASGDDEVALDAGALFLFERDASGWRLATKLAPADLAPGDRLGHARLDGERMIALAGDELLTFELSSGTWSERTRLARGASVSALALAGDLAALGLPSADIAAEDGGAVELFAFDAAPCRTLSTPRPVSWGKQRLEIDRGPAHAGHAYWLVGSLRGTARGIPYRGTRLPLDLDPYFVSLVRHPNSGLFTGNLGVLDAEGRASLVLEVPQELLRHYSGTALHHAFVEFGPRGFEHVSNAVTFRFWYLR